MNLWLITVNFGNTRSTSELINSVSIIEGANSIKIVVADNQTSPQSTEELKKIKRDSTLDISFFTYKQNYYYWPAAKKTLSALIQQLNDYPDWIMICNNDISFQDKDFLKKLKDIDSKKYPIIGPDISTPNGNKLNPFMLSELSFAEKSFWWMYFRSYLLSLVLLKLKSFINSIFPKSKVENQSFFQKVYAIHGSAILLSKYFFIRGGSLDDNFDMYGEEMSVAEIAKSLKIPITYCPKIKIMHHEHSITKNINKKLLFNKAKESYEYIKSAYKK